MKRICLIAGYDECGVIHDYVLYYAKQMSLFCDVYYMADSIMSDAELYKIKPFTKEAVAMRHAKYDFGSWQELILKLGWDKLSEYDELILCNDSCFGPLFDIESICSDAAKDLEWDFWGFTEGRLKLPHVQTYFLVLRQKTFMSQTFKIFIENISPLPKDQVIATYEIGLNKSLMDSSFKAKKFCSGLDSPYRQWKSLIKEGFPFLKKLALTDTAEFPHRESFKNWDKYLAQNTNYDINLIKKYLDIKQVDLSFTNTYSYPCIMFYKKFRRTFGSLFQIKLSRGRRIIRLFGFYLVNKNEEAKFLPRLNIKNKKP